MKKRKNENQNVNGVNKKDEFFEKYPSFDEIFTNKDYKLNKILCDSDIDILKTRTNKWEIIANLVDYMCKTAFNMPFYKYYDFKPNSHNFNYEECINIDGVGIMYDLEGNLYKVDYEEFLKLTLVMYLKLMNIKQTLAQYAEYLDFMLTHPILERMFVVNILKD